MKRIELRQGYVKLWRLGPVTFGEQSRWAARAPERQGLWAFPYPYFDFYFAYHKYLDLLPKELQGDEVPWDKKDEWIRKKGRRVIKLSTFWYRGDLHTHFLPNGEIGNLSEWHRTSSQEFGKLVQKTHGHTTYYRNGDGPLQSAPTSIDHLEVFVPQGRGSLRTSLQP